MTKEQIEKKAKEIANQWQEPSDYNIARDAATEMADWLLSNQWVSVKDEMPPKGEIVIAHYETADEIGEIFTTHDGTNWANVSEYFGDDAVTHWMSIPPLAEEGGEK